MAEIIKCVVCGSESEIKQLGEKDGYKIWLCGNCFASFVWPMPGKNDLKTLYDDPDWFEGSLEGGYHDYDAQTDHSVKFFSKILDGYGDKVSGKSILDVGCGYGNHLLEAARRGWHCYGIEISTHARNMASRRLREHGAIVAGVGGLPVQSYDLIVLFDVIEHLADPYRLLFDLFAKGAISEQTEIIITTPNARLKSAVVDPLNWEYLHPPSHLVYYSAEAIRFLFDKLLFKRIHFSSMQKGIRVKEGLVGEKLNHSFEDSEGIVCNVKGSDFRGFMQERYVPGSWSNLAMYEHIPRYSFARSFCKGRDVLDFGCGTGYGSQILADVAVKVTGLDIDQDAIKWATSTHRKGNLSYIRSENLGSELDDNSFDVITCFEMIEHVDIETQKICLLQFKRLLRTGGKLLISTPNPEVTAEYAENPYHIHEMTYDEFKSFLGVEFPNVEVLSQWISPCVEILGTDQKVELLPPLSDNRGPEAAYVAICSEQELLSISGALMVDPSFDFIKAQMDHTKIISRMKEQINRLKWQRTGGRSFKSMLRYFFRK